MKKTTRFAGIVFLFVFFLLPDALFARTNVTDWYIQDFVSQIKVNKDSTLDITETITADCGNAAGKHGIFRILPTSITIGTTKAATPVKLISITDQNGRAYNYSTTTDSSTVTWKIGDADKTVQGVNVYKIHYLVKNTIRFGDPKFDELYWNLNGNFWELQTDHFKADIIFSQEVTERNATVDYYTGSLGSRSKDMANYHWSAPNVLEFESTKMLDVRQGITASVIFPKDIFTPYQPTLWETYGRYVFSLIPISVFFICFFLWRKYGDDPEFNKTVIPEYEAPGALSPIEMGMLMKSGSFDNKLITAEIIFLATKGLITIKETHEKILFFDSKDYELTKQDNPEAEQSLNAAQKKILAGIFSGDKTKKLSALKNSFYKNLPEIKKAGEDLLESRGLVVLAGMRLAIGFWIGAFGLCWLGFMAMNVSVGLGFSLIASAPILVIFSFIMPKRTLAGAELNWKVKGFKLFMKTVDKDRAAFYEKENIFEKFLPYAVVFGITGEWIKRMKEIYGEEYFRNYAPVWYAGGAGSFDADSFSSTISSLSSSIAASTSSPSGSGGSGGSGGGGGGGGGGGW